MKFCKSLQRIAAVSDPSYAPYWTNYKLLKKLIKSIISGRDTEGESIGTSFSDLTAEAAYHSPATSPQLGGRTSAAAAAAMPPPPPVFALHDHIVHHHRHQKSAAAPAGASGGADHDEEHDTDAFILPAHVGLRSNPREVAFFRLVHAEVKKAQDFFEKVERECLVREQVITVGMEILNKPQACMVHDRWSVISRAIFFLYRDLLLLETFAIMTYFSFSKILKKHDKVTGFATRDSFMVNIVNKANFTNYPRLLEVIGRCQTLYNEASEKLAQDHLREDERLFLDMVSEWNTRNRDADTISTPASGQVIDGLPSPRIFAATATATASPPPAGRTASFTAATAGATSKGTQSATPLPPPHIPHLSNPTSSEDPRVQLPQRNILPVARAKRQRSAEKSHNSSSSSSDDDDEDVFRRPRKK
jgi:hypothetical protein